MGKRSVGGVEDKNKRLSVVAGPGHKNALLKVRYFELCGSEYSNGFLLLLILLFFCWPLHFCPHQAGSYALRADGHQCPSSSGLDRPTLDAWLLGGFVLLDGHHMLRRHQIGVRWRATATYRSFVKPD